MEPEFWHQRWREQRIGFHLPHVNPLLERHWPALGVPAQAGVFVPLCGKTLDMVWLAERGHPVTGVELSPLALEAFCREQGLEPEVADAGTFRRYQAGRLQLLEGDFFDLTPGDLEGVAGVWDRAALVAFPEAMRPAYARHLAGLLAPGTRMLLVTMDYSPGAMQGPPFRVADDEVERLFGDAFDLALVEQADRLAENPALAARGLDRLVETVWRLERRAR